MGIIIRQSVQNTVISYVGISLGFVVTIFMYPNILTTEQYGLTRVLISMAVVGSQLANFGINNTIVRFFPYFRDREKNHNGFLFIALTVPLVGFLFLGGIFMLFEKSIIQYFSERSALLLEYYWYLLPLAFFILYFHVLNYFIRALFDTVLASFLNEILIRILTAVLLVLYLFKWINFDQFVIIFVMNYGLILIILFLYTLFRKNISLKPDLTFLSKPLLKEIFTYSFFAFLGGVASIIVANIDIIMLSSLAGLEETGIYAISFYVGGVVVVVRGSIYKISAPIIASAIKEKNHHLVNEIYKKSSLNSIIGGGLLFCGIIANLENLMGLLPEAYAGGAAVIVVIAVANLFDMATGLNGAIILNSRYYRFDLYSTLFLIIITVVLNYLLIPGYGILGAAIGTASAIFLYNFLKVIFVWIRFSMQPFDWQIGWVFGIGILVLVLSFQVGTIGNIYLDIFIRSTVITIIYLIPIIILNISKDLNNLAAKTIAEIQNFMR